MVDTLAALAEPSRFRIVELLRTGPRPVGEISAALRLAQPQVSKHLKVLRDARLVAVEPRAQQRLYGLRGAPLRAMADWLDGYRRLWDERFDRMDDVITELQSPHRRVPHAPSKRR